jgi:hypothetical protein
MTQMSDPHVIPAPEIAANRATRQVRSPVARALHSYRTVVVPLLVILLGGCIIPPSYDTGTKDAGINSPPAILSVHADLQELKEPGPVSFTMGMGTMSFDLIDTDLDDTLYVKIFVDYNKPDPTPARSTCTASTLTTARRSATCPLQGLCQTADVGQTRRMDTVVFDRKVEDSGTPLYQAMAPTSGGLSTHLTFDLKCLPP